MRLSQGAARLRGMKRRKEKMSVDPVSTTQGSDQAEVVAANEKAVLLKPGKGELLLAGGTALFLYTALLLRLPYRAPIVNTLFSSIALSSIYFYLRLRLKIRIPSRWIICLVF